MTLFVAIVLWPLILFAEPPDLNPQCSLNTIFSVGPGVTATALHYKCFECTHDDGICSTQAASWCQKNDPSNDKSSQCDRYITPIKKPEFVPMIADLGEADSKCPPYMNSSGVTCQCKNAPSAPVLIKGTQMPTADECRQLAEEDPKKKECSRLQSSVAGACAGSRPVNVGEKPTSADGMKAWCAKLKTASEAAARAKRDTGETCTRAINACTTACESDAAEAKKCDQKDRVTALGSEGLEAGKIQQELKECERLAGGDPPPSSPAPQSTGPQTQPTASNPTPSNPQPTNQQPTSGSPNPGGGGGGGGGAGPGGGSSGYSPSSSDPLSSLQRPVADTPGFKQENEKQDSSGFNVGEIPTPQDNGKGMYRDGASPGDSGLDKIPGGRGGGFAGIANNTGGQIPGGSSGSGNGAKLGNKGGGVPGGKGYTTDILNGFQNGGGGGDGGGAAAGGNANELRDNSGKWGGYNGRTPAAKKAGLDLRRYLPGGTKDPGVRYGGLNTMSGEINGPHVNLWLKVSDRIQERCRLGRLYDCR